MGLFSKNSGTPAVTGWTVTGKGKQGVKATRKEWTAPRKGDHKSSTRPHK